MHNHHVESNCVILLGFTHLSLPYGKGKCIASLPCIWRRNLSHPKLQVTSVSFAWELKKASLEEKYGEIQKLWSNTKALEASRLPSQQASKYNEPAPLWLWSGTVFMASSTELNCFMSTLLLQRVLLQAFLLGGLFLVPSTRRATFSMQRSPNSGTAAFQKEKPEERLKTSIFRRHHTAKLITYMTRSWIKNNFIQISAHLLSHEAVGVLCHE